MCGIIGIASQHSSLFEWLLEGLDRLEYRGYDSAGIALLHSEGIFCKKSIGKVNNLRQNLKNLITEPIKNACLGMAHTRWATHGAVTEENAHPQFDGMTALVHNGIIENFSELKNKIPSIILKTQTDTEIIVHLISNEIQKKKDFLTAVTHVIQQIQGTFAFVILHKDFPHMMIAARKGSPLSIGKGIDHKSFFLASDVAAISPWVKKTLDLEDNELCLIKNENHEFLCHFFDLQGQEIQKKWGNTKLIDQQPTKGCFQDFTMKEMSEQPAIIENIVQSFHCEEFSKIAKEIYQRKSLNLIGCGSSFYAGLIAKYWFEKYGNIKTYVEIASEFRYRSPVISEDSLSFFISQSGETIDTLQALEFVKQKKGATGVITNVLHSTIAKKASWLIPLRAGPELSVVSTKAFTAQLAIFSSILIQYLIQKDSQYAKILQEDFEKVPYLLKDVFSYNNYYDKIIPLLIKASTILYLGRGICYPIAMEGALKLKETSYVHAEGYPAGEMKHGPIALIDAHSVCIVLAPYDELFSKMLSNVQEIIARQGKVIFLTDKQGAESLLKQNISSQQLSIILAPETQNISKAFVYSVLCQILAYKTAKLKGCNIDRPRNLAKSVTVE